MVAIYTTILGNCALRCSTSCIHAVVRWRLPCSHIKITIFRSAPNFAVYLAQLSEFQQAVKTNSTVHLCNNLADFEHICYVVLYQPVFR